jgi:hypothetical protein
VVELDGLLQHGCLRASLLFIERAAGKE